MRSILERLALFALSGVIAGLDLTASRPEAGRGPETEHPVHTR
jgi:hypothetical protein